MSDTELAEFARSKWAEAKQSRLVFTHLHGRFVWSPANVTTVIKALGATACDEPQGPVAISYLLRNPTDVIIARSRYDAAVGTIQEQGNEFNFTTFASWKDNGAYNKQILLLDGDQSTMSSIDSLVMLDLRQQLDSRAEKEGFQCLVLMITPYLQDLAWRDRAAYPVHRYQLRGQNFHAVEHYVENWKNKAMEIMEKKLRVRLDEMTSVPGPQRHSQVEEYGPTFVLLMRYDDARDLLEQLKQVSRNVEFGCVMPWSDLQSIEAATSRSRWLKLIYIDDTVVIMPLIESCTVLIAPTGDRVLPSMSIHSVFTMSKVPVRTDARIQAAFSLSTVQPHVHKFCPSYSMGARIDTLSPACGSQLLHFEFGVIKACKYRHLVDESIRLPPDPTMSDEARRQLEVLGLIYTENPSAMTWPKAQHTLDMHAARFSRLTSNINSMVLLSCIGEDMSNTIANILIDMAVLVCQGPSTIFFPATSAAKIDAAERIRHLNGPLAHLVDRGQLWLSLACLNVYRDGGLTEIWSSMLRKEVISRVQDRAAHIKTWFGIEQDGFDLKLAGRDVQIIEDQLARAFLFNIMLTDDARLCSPVDLKSRMRLRQAEDDPLDWHRLRRYSDTPGVFAGVYTYMESPSDNDSMTFIGYRPHDVTVLSLRAVAKAVGEVGGPASLWPDWELPGSLRVHKDEIVLHFEDFELSEKEKSGLEEVEAYDGPSATA